MNQEDRGKIILEAVQDKKAEELVVACLGRMYKGASPEKVAALVKKTPIVLSRRVPSNKARMIVAHLQKLGATVVYVPEAEAQREPRVRPSGSRPKGSLPPMERRNPPRSLHPSLVHRTSVEKGGGFGGQGLGFSWSWPQCSCT